MNRTRSYEDAKKDGRTELDFFVVQPKKTVKKQPKGKKPKK